MLMEGKKEKGCGRRKGKRRSRMRREKPGEESHTLVVDLYERTWGGEGQYEVWMKIHRPGQGLADRQVSLGMGSFGAYRQVAKLLFRPLSKCPKGICGNPSTVTVTIVPGILATAQNNKCFWFFSMCNVGGGG
jgi:hypothetical protein